MGDTKLAFAVDIKRLSERVDSLESRLARLESAKSYADEKVDELVRGAFNEEDDILCKDLEEMMYGLGISKAGYKRSVRRLKAEGFFVMEKFGVNWAFHVVEENDDADKN